MKIYADVGTSIIQLVSIADLNKHNSSRSVLSDVKHLSGRCCRKSLLCTPVTLGGSHWVSRLRDECWSGSNESGVSG